MKYFCELCDYTTDIKFAYERHLTAKKHIINAKNKLLTDSSQTPQDSQSKEIKCPYCNMKYSRVNNLTRHKKVCTENPDNKKDSVELLKNNLTHALEMIKKLEEDKKNLETDKQQLNDNISHYKSLLNNAGLVIKKSVSALSYVATNYKDAPKLDKLDDYSYLQYEDENDDFDLLEIVFTNYRENKLHKYLGDIIIKAYKKGDPSKQSIWNSDASRLTYLIRDLIKKKPDWTLDKGGVKTTKYIIDPLLYYLRELLRKFIDENCLENFIGIDTDMRFKKRIADLDTTSQIIYQVTNKYLAPEIIKYIAPHFSLTKNDELITT